MIDLNDNELLARMRNFEDHLVERKVVKDERDWKKTAVAFANSVPIGLPAVLYIGVRDNGEIELPQPNLDEAQKRFNLKMQRVYPRIAYVPRIVTENGRQALAIVIPGSESRPHFAGLSYVRKGSESIEASEEQFSDLIAQHNSKAAMILRWRGQNVTVFTRMGDSETAWPDSSLVVECNQFYVTIRRLPHEPPNSFPLSRVEITFDNLKRRLQLEIADIQRNEWSVGLERQVFQIVGSEMTHDGQLLLKHLLARGKIECPRQFIPESSMETQTKQMEIAVKNGLVSREQEGAMRQTYYVVNPEFAHALKKVLPNVLG